MSFLAIAKTYGESISIGDCGTAIREKKRSPCKIMRSRKRRQQVRVKKHDVFINQVLNEKISALKTETYKKITMRAGKIPAQ